MAKKTGFVVMVKDLGELNKMFPEFNNLGIGTPLYVHKELGSYIEDLSKAKIWDTLEDLHKDGGDQGGVISEVICEIEYELVVVNTISTTDITLPE